MLELKKGETDMEIFPETTVTTITTGLSTALDENVGVILAVLALGIGIRFVMRFFNKSAKKVKP